jgi:hypothetical protein
MTDTNGLRQMLDELADQTPEVPAQEWLAGTRHKVRVRRRARWAGAGGAMALALAAAVVAPQVVDRSNTEPKPVEPTPDGQSGWPFPESMDTERVIAARVNDPGASEFEWTTKTERSSDTLYMQFCHLSRRPEPGLPRIHVRLTINGHRALGWGCRYREDYPPVHGALVTQDVSRDLEEMYDVEPGKPFSVAMWLERQGQRVDVTGVSFGFALATCRTAPVDDSDGGVDPPSGGVPRCVTMNFPGAHDSGVGVHGVSR